jgi:ketosteroid isomerase-like protein
VATNAEVLMKAFASRWGKGRPPALDGALRPEAELIVPESMPYGGGVFRGQQRIEKWFAEDLWELWREFSSTPVDFIDAGDKIVVPVHIKGTTHNGPRLKPTTSGSTSSNRAHFGGHVSTQTRQRCGTP